MQRFAWMSARTVSQAAAAATAITAELMTRPTDATPSEAAIVKAGGIDVLDLLKENLLAPARLVSLRNVPGLNIIAEEAGELRIGAMATLARVGADPSVGQRYPALADALRSAASPQIRNVATLGAATCCNVRAAGISAPKPSSACARAAAIASRMAARTSITPSSTTMPARSSIRPPPRPSLWHLGRT